MARLIARRRLLAGAALLPAGLVAACGSGAAAPTAAPVATTKPASTPAASPAPASAAPAAATTAPTTAAAAVTAPAAPKTGGNVALTWWTTGAGLNDKLAQEYSEQAGVTITTQVQGNYDEMVKKVQAGIAANALPHLAILGQRHGIPQMADSGKLIPLADLIKADPAFGEGDFLPAFWKKFTYKGKIQTTPFINSSPVLHYNRTAMKAAGLNPDQPPATWEQLVSAAKELTRREGSTVSQWGVNTAGDTPWYAYALIWQNGGALLNAEGQPVFNDEAGAGALQFWHDLVHTHKVMPAVQHKQAKDDFVAGKIGFFFSSSASTGGFEKEIGDKFEYGVARFPGNKARAVPVGGASLGIFRSDQAREQAAWGLVKWLTSPEINARISTATGYVAIRNATLELPAMKEYLSKNPRRSVAIQQVREDIRAEGITPADGVVWLGLGKVQESLEADAGASPKKLLDDLAAETAKYLKEY